MMCSLLRKYHWAIGAAVNLHEISHSSDERHFGLVLMACLHDAMRHLEGLSHCAYELCSDVLHKVLVHSCISLLCVPQSARNRRARSGRRRHV